MNNDKLFSTFKPISTNRSSPEKTFAERLSELGLPINPFLEQSLQSGVEEDTSSGIDYTAITGTTPTVPSENNSQNYFEIDEDLFNVSSVDNTKKQTYSKISGNVSGKINFTKAIKPLALQAEEEYGIPHKLIIAQLALETGWGESVHGNNLGNIIATGWKGKTMERGDKDATGKKKSQKFRVYDTLEEGFNDYIRLLANSDRYASVIGVTDPYEAAELMGKSGYAEAKNYGKSLKDVIDSIPTI